MIPSTPSRWFRLLAATGLVLAAAPLLAAEQRGGGMRQPPLEAPGMQRKPGPAQPLPGRQGIAASPEARAPVPVAVPERPESAAIMHRGTRYLVTGGRWYEQRGNDLVAVAPPAGVLVQDLPDGYVMRWVGGVPYFHADGLYYVWRERSRRYEILQAPPVGERGAASEGRAESARESVATP